MTACSLGTICGLFGIDADDQPYRLVGGIAQEILERLHANSGAAQPKRWLGAVTVPYDLFSMKITLDELVQEAGVQVAFHAQFVGLHQERGRTQAVIMEDKSGRWAVRAAMFIDATGDADVVVAAGGRCEFELATLQLPTTTFRMASVEDAVARAVTREQLREILENSNAQGAALPRTCGGVYFHKPGMPHLNLTRIKHRDRSPNPFDTFELTEAEFEGRRQVRAYERAFRASVPGYQDAYVVDSGIHIGIRESRRIIGEFRLELSHIRSGARFDDAIAACSWPVEVHEKGTTNTRWDWLPPGVSYQVPFRCLVPQRLSNVLVAGRCLSASHEAHGSVRVTATCMAMGQAAGVAAALTAQAGLEDTRQLPPASLRQALDFQGAMLDCAQAT